MKELIVRAIEKMADVVINGVEASFSMNEKIFMGGAELAVDKQRRF